MKDISEDRNPVEALAEDYLERHRKGESPDLAEYTEKYPELAEEIEDLFPALLMMEDIRPDSGDETGTFGGSPEDGPKLQQIGDYRVLREVGRGGMGVVYEALHESLGRRVALKVLPQHATLDHKQLRRFDREVKSAARLHHTNIVPIFGVGHEDGIHYYVMQFIQGLGLDEVLVELKQLQSESASGARKPEESPLPNKNHQAPVTNEATQIQRNQVAEDRTLRQDVSAVNIARSLMAGQFEHTLVTNNSDGPSSNQERKATLDDDGDATMLSTSLQEEDKGRAADPSLGSTIGFEDRNQDWTLNSPSSSPERSTATGRLSETFSLSSASLSSQSMSLPGTSETPETRKARKQTYWHTVANVGMQVASALRYAHEQGILHRDIKPSNLLLDMAGTVWVTDFGLAKADDQQDITHTGDIIGTLRYMPPEAFEGRTDNRSDVYSLGLTLYELLTLEPAFNEKDRNSLIKQVTAETPSRLNRLNPEIPRDLVTIVHKAIDRDPGHRYQTANDLAEDLYRFLEDEPIKARRLSLPERFIRWARRNKSIAALATAIVLLLAVTAVGSSLAALNFEKLAEDNKQLANDSDLQKNKAIEATKQANLRRTEAVAAQKKAEQAREKTLLAQEKLRRELYFSDMQQVRQAFEDGSNLRVRELLDKYIPIADETDLRGFEWYHWWRAVNLHTREITGYGPFGPLAVSPDRKWVAVPGWGAWIHIFDAETAEHVFVKKSGPGDNNAEEIAFSADGKFLVAMGTDRAYGETNRVRLWRTGTWTNVANFDSENVLAVAFSTTDPLLAMADKKGTIRFWNLETRKYEGLPIECNMPLSDLAFSPDGDSLIAIVVRSTTGEIRPAALVCSVSERTLKTKIDGRPLEGGRVAWATTPTDSLIATGSLDGRVQLWDGKTLRIIDTLTTNGGVTSISFSTDGGKLIVTTRGDNAVYVWDAVSFDLITTIKGHSQFVDGAEFVDDGETLWSSSDDMTIKIWNLAHSQPSDLLATPYTEFWESKFITFGRDNQTLRQRDSHGVLYDVELEKQAFAPIIGETAGETHSISSENGSYFVTLTKRDTTGITLHLWNTEGNEPVSVLQRDLRDENLPWPEKNILAVSSDGSKIAWAQEPHVTCYDVDSGTIIRAKVDPNPEYSDIALSPDGKYLALTRFWGSDIFEINVNGLVRKYWIEGENGPIMDVAFSEDGTRLATGHWNSDARLYDMKTGKEVRKFRGHAGGVMSVTFSNDGSLLATGGMDGTVRLWDLSDGKQRMVLPAGHREIADIAISRDNGTIAASNEEGLHVWKTTSPQELEADADYWVRRSARNIRQDRFADAVDDLLKAVNCAPGNAAILTPHVYAAVRAGRWNDAALLLSKAVEIDPDEHLTAYKLAPLLLQNRDEAAYRRLRTEMLRRWEDTTDPMIAERTAKACLLLPAEGEELQTAVDLAERALRDGRAHPLFPFFQLVAGMARYRKGDDYQAAVTTLNTALPKFSSDQRIRYRVLIQLFLAMSYQKLDQPEKARELFRSAEQLILNHLPSRNGEDLGDGFHDVMNCWIIHREASNLVMGPAYRLLIEVRELVDQGHKEEAIEKLTEIEEVTAEDTDVYQLRAELNFELKRWDQAAEDYARVLETLDKNTSFLSERTKLLIRLCRRQELFDALSRQLPRDKDLILGRARSLALQNRWREAAQAYAAFNAPFDRESEIGFEQACACLLVDDLSGYRKILDQYRRNVKENSSSNAHFTLARTASMRPQDAEIVEMAVQAAEHAVAEDERPWLQFVHGLSQFRAGNFTAAESRFQSVLQNSSWGRPQVLLGLALVAHKQNDRAKMQEWLLRARQLINDELESADDGLVDVQVVDWLPIQVLLREAEALIQENQQTRN